jgi:SNF2 family DNA or RNA helicase
LKQHINPSEVQALVDDYLARNTIPSLQQLTRVDRPANADGFRKLEQSPVFNEGYEQGLELRPYQVDGLNWLIFNWMSHRNVILSDEMGLGKTAQTVSMVHYLHSNYNDRGPFLIVGPLSAVPHFAREFERFTNLQVVLYKDDNVSRELQRLTEFHYHDENGHPVYKDQQGRPIFKFNVLITTYEILRSDLSHLRQINWHFVCIDEAHRLKNSVSSRQSSPYCSPAHLFKTISKNFGLYSIFVIAFGFPAKRNSCSSSEATASTAKGLVLMPLQSHSCTK